MQKNILILGFGISGRAGRSKPLSLPRKQQSFLPEFPFTLQWLRPRATPERR